MKPINTSVFDFPTLIQGGYVYVDKTAQIYELAKPDADRIYFFPRPRRFGKSLLLSTLKSLFQGKRELFENLAIEKTDWDWSHEIYPVVHLDMSKAACANADELEIRLNLVMRHQCELLGVPHDPKFPASANFIALLDALPKISPNGKYVLLIDEYDAPISGLLDGEELRRALPAVRKALHDFYVVAKANCAEMRFMMVTGVSKFAKTSIFSAFNNPKDVSLDARTADLLGYTHEEMRKYFAEHIAHFAERRNESFEAAFAELTDWYDSYQFAPSRLVKVLNPVSVGNALSNCELRGYWESTAGSTLIFDALKQSNKAPFDFADEFAVTTLDSPDALEAPTAALLYQGGYLTVDRRINDRAVLLKIPNHEVRESLERGYIARLLGKDFELDAMQRTAEDTAARFVADGYTESFKTMLQSAFSRLPHDWVCKDELDAKRYFLSFMVFARADVVGEEQHATGRPDAVLRTEKAIYVFEFKYGQTAKAAIKQCRDRNYAAAFVGDGLPIHYVGVNYNPRKNVRTVDDVICEPAVVPSTAVSETAVAENLV